jgi:hypothetical protein
MQVQSVESKIINSVNELIQDLATFAMNMGTQALFETKLKERDNSHR